MGISKITEQTICNIKRFVLLLKYYQFINLTITKDKNEFSFDNSYFLAVVTFKKIIIWKKKQVNIRLKNDL